MSDSNAPRSPATQEAINAAVEMLRKLEDIILYCNADGHTLVLDGYGIISTHAAQILLDGCWVTDCNIATHSLIACDWDWEKLDAYYEARD